MMPIPLKLARFRFDFTVETPLHLHYYAGSQLRGAFGMALKRTVCMTRMADCHDCPLYRSCVYPAVFETPAPEDHRLQQFSQIPNPYVIEPPPMGARNYQPGETLSFHHVLIGHAIKQLPIIVYAWQRALARQAGMGGGNATLSGISYLPAQGPEQSLYTDGELITPTLAPLPNTPLPNPIRLKLQTPLRLQQAGSVKGYAMTGRDFLMALIRRYWLLAEFHQDICPDIDFKQQAAQAEAIVLHGQLVWRDWQRYSNRQQQRMVLGGVMGTIELHGDLTPFTDCLIAGQWTHLGKNASFGLGQYVIEARE